MILHTLRPQEKSDLLVFSGYRKILIVSETHHHLAIAALLFIKGGVLHLRHLFKHTVGLHQIEMIDIVRSAAAAHGERPFFRIHTPLRRITLRHAEGRRKLQRQTVHRTYGQTEHLISPARRDPESQRLLLGQIPGKHALRRIRFFIVDRLSFRILSGKKLHSVGSGRLGRIPESVPARALPAQGDHDIGRELRRDTAGDPGGKQKKDHEQQ